MFNTLSSHLPVLSFVKNSNNLHYLHSKCPGLFLACTFYEAMSSSLSGKPLLAGSRFSHFGRRTVGPVGFTPFLIVGRLHLEFSLLDTCKIHLNH